MNRKLFPVLLLTTSILLSSFGCAKQEETTKKKQKKDRKEKVEETVDETTEKTEKTEEPSEQTEAPDVTHETIDTPPTLETLVIPDPEPQILDLNYAEAYIDTINAISDEYNTVYDYTYKLIDVNGDVIPELVIDMPGYFVYVYTYSNGEVYPIIDGWGYGAFGLAGYMYTPGENIISYHDNDYAGALTYYECLSYDFTAFDFNEIWYGSSQMYAEGSNPGSSDCVYLDEPIYFLGDTPSSADEFNSKPWGTIYIEGLFDYDTMIGILNTDGPHSTAEFDVFITDCTWEEASAQAAEYGGHLATISSPEELQMVNALATLWDGYYSDKILYVGAQNVNGELIWTADGSNETVMSSLWRTNEPSYTGSTEDGRTVDENYTCVLYNSSTGTYEMMDVPNDMIDAAPTYSGYVGYIIEYT